MSCTGALKTFFHLYSTIIWNTPLFLGIFGHSAFTVDKAVFEAVWFWLPGNEWRIDNQTDGWSARQTDGCMFFREKL